MFGANRAEQSASYFAPVVAYQPVAAKLARLIAGRLRLRGAACNASLHFPAGGAPWGFQDIDTHIYMREWSPPAASARRVCTLLTQAVPCRLERRLRQPALSEPLRVHAEQDLRAADNLASG